MKSATVSGLARRTGHDRRSIERDLAGLRPLRSKRMADGRTFCEYDENEALRRIRGQSAAPVEGPFGGSAMRLVAFTLLQSYVRRLGLLLEADRARVVAELGLSERDATLAAATAACGAGCLADHMLANFDELFPELVECDSRMFPSNPPSTNAAPGEFTAEFDRLLPERIGRLFADAAAVAPERRKRAR